MKVTPLHEAVADGAVCVEPSDSCRSLADVSRDDVIALFERHGAVLLRGFDLSPEGVVGFTDRFTEQYRQDTETAHTQKRRPLRFGQKHLASVTSGMKSISLHSEAAHGVVWPEIIWFYCNVPSTTGAFTTLCDGVQFWRALSSPTRISFLSQPLKYDLELPLPRKVPGAAVTPWPFETPGVSGFIDKDQGLVRLSVRRYAVTETRVRGKLAFANYILHIVDDGDVDIKRLAMADDTAIEPLIMDEIKRVANELTFDLHWQARDIVMVDNRRYMHGRRTVLEGDPRDILQIQTIRSSFAYGATTHGAISRD
jgi:alpha-ketoglutarate-dependent taurine dioxygenase